MAKKKSDKEKSMPVTAESVVMRPVKIELGPELHRKLRFAAADDDLSMTQWVYNLVANALNTRDYPDR